MGIAALYLGIHYTLRYIIFTFVCRFD